MRIIAVGDILPAEGAISCWPKAPRMPWTATAYDYPFCRLKVLIADHDLLVDNLEGPIADHPTPISRYKDVVFKTRARVATALREVGFDLLDLANNQVLD